MSFRDYRNLSENPSGLGIALYCKERGIPFLIASEGNRHYGNQGLIRYALQYSTKAREIFGIDPLEHIMAFGGLSTMGYSKSEERTWIAVLEELKYEIQD